MKDLIPAFLSNNKNSISESACQPCWQVIFCVLLFTAIFSSTGICQTSLSGKITDGDTGEELIAANVTLYKAGVLITGCATDFDGNYSLNLDPGTYYVEVSYIGYQASRINGLVVQAGQMNSFDATLGTGWHYGPPSIDWAALKGVLVPFLKPVLAEGDFVEVLANGPGG